MWCIDGYYSILIIFLRIIYTIFFFWQQSLTIKEDKKSAIRCFIIHPLFFTHLTTKTKIVKVYISITLLTANYFK